MLKMILKDIAEENWKTGKVKFSCLQCGTNRDVINVENLLTVLIAAS